LQLPLTDPFLQFSGVPNQSTLTPPLANNSTPLENKGHTRRRKKKVPFTLDEVELFKFNTLKQKLITQQIKKNQYQKMALWWLPYVGNPNKEGKIIHTRLNKALQYKDENEKIKKEKKEQTNSKRKGTKEENQQGNKRSKDDGETVPPLPGTADNGIVTPMQE
jgi:hypothetical protein